jgi:hypothetical protein
MGKRSRSRSRDRDHRKDKKEKSHKHKSSHREPARESSKFEKSSRPHKREPDFGGHIGGGGGGGKFDAPPRQHRDRDSHHTKNPAVSLPGAGNKDDIYARLSEFPMKRAVSKWADGPPPSQDQISEYELTNAQQQNLDQSQTGPDAPENPLSTLQKEQSA